MPPVYMVGILARPPDAKPAFLGGHGANRTDASKEASVSLFLLHPRTKELSFDTHAPVLNPMGSPTKPVPSTHAQSVALKFATADSFGTS